MPYLIETTTDKDYMKQMLGMTGEDLEILGKAAAMEWWGSSFEDPGPDYNEFRLLDSKGNLLRKKVTQGY